MRVRVERDADRAVAETLGHDLDVDTSAHASDQRKLVHHVRDATDAAPAEVLEAMDAGLLRDLGIGQPVAVPKRHTDPACLSAP